MLRRLIQVLFTLSVLLFFGTIFGMIIWNANVPNDPFDQFGFILLTVASSLPLIIILILKYIIYGSLK